MALLRIPELGGVNEGQDAIKQLNPINTFGDKVGQEAAPLNTPDWLAPRSLVDGSEAAAGWNAIANEAVRQLALKKAEDHARLQETKLDFQIAADKLKEEVKIGQRTVANADGSETVIKLHDGEWNTDQKNEYFNLELSKLKDAKFFNGQFDGSDEEIKRHRDLAAKEVEYHAGSNWKKTVIEPERVAAVSAIIERSTQAYKDQAYNATSLDDLRKVQTEAADFITQPYAMGVLSPEQLNSKMMSLKSEMAFVFASRGLDGMSEKNYQQTYIANKVLIENTNALPDLTPEQRLKLHDQNEHLKIQIEHQIEVKKAKAEAEAKHRQAEYHKANDFKLWMDVEQGKAGLPEITRAFQQGRISPQDFKERYGQWKTNMNKEDNAFRSYDVVNAQIAANSKPTDQGDVNKWWKLKQGTITSLAPELQADATVQSLKAVAVLPDEVKKQLEGNARSDNPANVQAAILFGRKLLAADPTKLGQLSTETRAAILDADGGRSVAQIMTTRDKRLAMSETEKKVIEANIKDELKTKEGNRVADPVASIMKKASGQSSWFSSYSEADPKVQGLAGEFYQHHRLSGATKEQAIQLAAQDLKNKVGTNTVDGSKRLMIDAPHNVYQQPPEIIAKQFQADIKTLSKDPSSIRLGDIAGAGPDGVPRYTLMEKNKDGFWVTLKDDKNMPKTWAFDAAAHVAEIKKEQDAELEAARKARERGSVADVFGVGTKPTAFSAGFKKK